MHRTPRLNHFTGNRLELLVDSMATRLGADPLDPVLRETIIVPSRGMGSWLQRELAHRWGIAASLDLPAPAQFVDRLAEAFGLGRPAPVDPWRTAAQLWDLHELFWRIEAGEVENPALVAVGQHLRDDVDGRKRYQLARRVAALFSNYQFARPQGVLDWGQARWFGEQPDELAGEAWQRALWQHLLVEHPDAPPPAARLLQLVRRLGAGDPVFEKLPERVSVFGASTLPRMFTELLVALSRHRPVDLYLLVPTTGYVADLRNRRQRARTGDDGSLGPAEELVAELGRLGREFFDVLLDLDTSGAAIEEAGFADPGSSTVLGHLQSSLLATGTGTPPVAQFAPDDRSVQLHCCHSPLREMEVLRDAVLAALEEGAARSVADVLLLVPDIREYAPIARSVFGAEIDNGDGTISLPIRVADRSGPGDQPFARLVLQWLELAFARLTIAEVFPLLHERVVCARFGLSEDQLDALRDRLVEAGVIWGIDPVTRARRTATPEFVGASWREGLDRLLLGCFTGPLDELVDGQLPAADATVSDAEALGQLATALDRTFALLGQLEGPQSLVQWSEKLRAGILDITEVSGEQESTERARCLQVLERLAADAGPHTAPVGRLAVLDLLRREFESMDSGAGFISGCVTVAELRPMRSLPAGVIAVAGLDADSFPRRDPRDGLDLVAQHPRPGDRSPRDDDRQLFLELLLCARERLILSWVGRSQKDGHLITLSPCVQELVDALAALGAPEVLVQHSLQPFVGVDCRETTYDGGMARAAVQLNTPEAVPRLVDVPVAVPDRAAVERIELGDLRRFWAAPSRWFCRDVMDLALIHDREESEAEAWGLDGLTRWKVRDFVLRHGGQDPTDPRMRMRLGLPDHAFMARELEGQRVAVRATETALGSPLSGLQSVPVRVEGPDFVVSGTIEVDATGRMVELVAGSSLKGKYVTSALVAHIVAGAAGRAEASAIGPLASANDLEIWQPLEDSPAALAQLVEGYRQGQVAPLRFYPETSLAFAKVSAKSGGATPGECHSESAFVNAWSRSPEDAIYGGPPGECHDEAVALCIRGFEDAQIFDEEFVRWATALHAWLTEARG